MKLSLASRVTAAFLLVVVVLTFGSVGLVGMLLRTSLEEVLLGRLELDLATWSALLEQEGRVLAATSRGAVNGPILRAVLASEDVDTRTLEGIAADQRSLLAVDLFVLMDPKGRVRAGSAVGPLPTNLAALLKRQQVGLLMIEDTPYWCMSSPVEANGRTVGHLAMGIRLGDELLRRLREQSGAEPLLTRGNTVTASGLQSVDSGEVLAALRTEEDSRRFLQLRRTRVLAAQQQVGSGLRLVLVRSVDEEFSRFRVTLIALLGVGLAGAVVAGGVAFLLARRVTGPLRQLTAAAARVVAEGDFQASLDVRSRDEIGDLAQSFEEMMGRLREVLLALRAASERSRGRLQPALRGGGDAEPHRHPPGRGALSDAGDGRGAAARLTPGLSARPGGAQGRRARGHPGPRRRGALWRAAWGALASSAARWIRSPAPATSCSSARCRSAASPTR